MSSGGLLVSNKNFSSGIISLYWIGRRFIKNLNLSKSSLTFFTVELINGSVLATPIDSSGLLKPVTMNLVDPMKYFKERAEGKF